MSVRISQQLMQEFGLLNILCVYVRVCLGQVQSWRRQPSLMLSTSAKRELREGIIQRLIV
jgi:hypothetical protein